MKHITLLLLILLTTSFQVTAQSVSDDVTSLLNKASSALESKKYKEALAGFNQTVEKTSLLRNKADKSSYATSMLGASECCVKLGMYKDGMDKAEKLINMHLSDSLHNKALQLYFDNGYLLSDSILNGDELAWAEPRAILEKLFPVCTDKQKEKANILLQRTYIKEAQDYEKNLNQQKSKECLLKAYEISDDLNNRVEILFYLGTVYESLGKIDKAVDVYDRIRLMAQKEPLNYYLMKSLSSLREIALRVNDMEKYATLCVSLDSLIAVTTDPSLKVEHYINMGKEYLNQKNYDVAESYFQRTKKYIFANKSSVDSDVIFTYYSCMYDLMVAKNDYKGIIKYSDKQKQFFEENVGRDFLMIDFLYMFDSNTYAKMKDRANFNRCRDIMLAAYDKMPDAYNKSYVFLFLGIGYSEFGEYKAALKYYEKADSVLSEQYDETFEPRLACMNNRAKEYINLHRYADACRLYEKYALLIKKVKGKKSNDYSEALFFLANAEKLNGELKNSARHYIESSEILEKILRSQLRFVPTSSRSSYIDILSRRMWKMSSFALNYSSVNGDFVKRCYNNIMLLKSLLYESDRSMYNTLQLRGSKEDVNDFVYMSYLRNKQKTLLKDYEKNKTAIDENDLKILEIDNKLILKSKAYSEYTGFLDFKYEDLCKSLGDKDVLFDFFDYEDQSQKQVYVAYVIKKNNKNPLIVEMFSEEQVDSLLGDYSLDYLYSQSISDKVINIFWSKLKQYACNGGTVYYVPSGIMHQISLTSLPLHDGTLLGEHYNFARLTSAREVTRMAKMLDKENCSAVLYGGLQYDVDVADIHGSDVITEADISNALHGRYEKGMKFNYLPETLLEVEKISKILKNSGYDVTLYSGKEGTESSFLNMHNNSPQVIHMATHGFYYTPESAAEHDFLKGCSDAMLLSGLVMSGGNKAWSGEDIQEGSYDGILSAGNISWLDLSNCEMAVLSSCQSAKGRITREGLFGLQRAFKKAGVKTIVMTLWDVSDVVTQKFMVEFYKNLLTEKKYRYNKRKAFEKAKKTIRSKYPEPLYWAGFVMVD